MTKKFKVFIVAFCVLCLLLGAGGIYFLVTEIWLGFRSQNGIVASNVAGYVEYALSLWDGQPKWVSEIHAEYIAIDPKTKEIELLIEAMPFAYFPDLNARLHLNGKKTSMAWDKDEAVLTTRTKITLGEPVTEYRIVLVDGNNEIYRQHSLLYNEGLEEDEQVVMEHCFGRFPLTRSVFSSHESRRLDFSDIITVKGNSFHWRSSYAFYQDLPFHSKAVSARLYIWDSGAGKEVFSKRIEDGEASVDHKISLRPGKTQLELYGEATCEDGIKYRYFIGEVLQEDEEAYNYAKPGAFYYRPASELHAFFPDGTAQRLLMRPDP